MKNLFATGVLILVASQLTHGCAPPAEKKDADDNAPKKAPVTTASEENKTTVKLVVDYGDGVEKHFTKVPWKSGMRIDSAMDFAAKHARGIKYEVSGKGETAFLLSIDGQKNEGNTGKKRNWMFYVNQSAGTASFAVHELKAGDMIVWKFKTFDSDF